MDVLTVVKRSPFALPVACVAAVAMVFISEGSYLRSTAKLENLATLATVRTSIQSLVRGVLEAESGQRGFLLTGRQEYLAVYGGALRTINESFTTLDPFYSSEPGPKETMAKLRGLTQTKLSEIAETIRLHQAGNGDAARELVLTNIGKDNMDLIRTLSAELLARETFNFAEGRADIFHSLMVARISVALLTAFALLGVVLYLRQSSALDRQQREQQRLLQAERDQLEIVVAKRTAVLTEMTRHMHTVREDERARLARDLHDELGALLTSAKLDAARIRSRLAGTAPEAMERLNHLVDTLNSGIAMKRRIIEDLRPSALSNLGLVATLEILAREFADQSGIAVHCELAPVALEEGAELVIYRVVQEAITNISKYARARNVWVRMAALEGRVHVTVRDDGVGFDTSVQAGSTHGLVGMRFRVEAEGGNMSVGSTPGQGTQIHILLPQSAPVAA